MKNKLGALLGLALGVSLLTTPTPAGAAPAAGNPDGPPLGAAPVATQPADLPAGQLAALRRDLDLTAAELTTRLAVEATAGSIEQRLRTELADAYAGTWVAEDGRTVVVGVTDPAQADRVRAAGAQARTVTRGLADLERLAAGLDRRAKAAGSAVHAWYVDPVSNTVAIQAADAASATGFAHTAGLPADAVSVVRADEAYRPVADIRGGDQYVINNSVLCSVGFAVAGGFVTAGHCGGVGATTAGSGIAQGTFRGSSFPGDDYAWVQTNSSWVSRPWVNNYSGGTVNVTGSQEAAVGASICRSGRTTGWRCGTITAKNVTVNYSGQLVYGLVRSTACAQGGDSGGAVLAGTQAQGVTSGAGGTCSSGGTTVYQPVNEILSRYGLSLTTTGGGGSTSRLIGLGDKCIDVPNSNAVDGQHLQLYRCNGTAAQNWTFPGDGTIRAMGLCMDVAWGSTANNAVVQLANCSGNPAQQWVLSGAGDLVNPQANKCVDVVNGSTADGARLVIYECLGGANQKWRRG
ncbi:ricin-type beta-trefoil lectin domain protein [Micromonospora sp. NBC_01813]|uniref:ricin-type beta-trefoil lectin domain protein n=1 Tax=Micromonospora sp. NBC_01813 TaxID=2975988 RepID=UPI002DDA3483|nr:ricin-type beta-trefoil lectin domain protein [Micromonospora sp. NBC_01813]WSA07744.1 ricin-type beta-trefoil lectin domain protein [Micromonospora sp. NBC_01813]